MLNWFYAAVKYEKTAEEGKIVKVVENYLVDALSFTEAEKRMNEEMKPFISGEFVISKIRRARINELFANANGDKWYKAKVLFVSLDEEKGVEKLTPATTFAQADDLSGGLEVIKEGMKGSMANYRIVQITETDIMDVFPYVAPVEENTETGEEKTNDEG